MIDEDIDCTSPEIIEEAKITTANLLPKKLGRVYEAAYKLCMSGVIRKKANSFSDSVLLACFAEAAENYKSSLWTQYSILRSILEIPA